jgi:hypothetical protein
VNFQVAFALTDRNGRDAGACFERASGVPGSQTVNPKP